MTNKTATLYEIQKEKIFKALFSLVKDKVQERIIGDNQFEYFINDKCVAKVVVDQEKEVVAYYMDETIIRDVQCEENEDLSTLELNFINKALEGDLGYISNIMMMPVSTFKTIYEEAKQRGFPKIGKNDFHVKKKTIISKEKLMKKPTTINIS